MRVPDTFRVMAASWLIAGCGASGEEGPRVPPYTVEQATIKVQAQQELPKTAVIHAEADPGGPRPDTGDARAPALETTPADESSSEREKRDP